MVKSRVVADADDDALSQGRKTPTSISSKSETPLSSGHKQYFQRMPKSAEVEEERPVDSPKNVRRNLFPNYSNQSEYSDISSDEPESIWSDDSEHSPFHDEESEESSDGIIPPTPELFSEEESSGHSSQQRSDHSSTTTNIAAAAKHPMLASCGCKKKCIDLINEPRRKQLHQQLWNMPYIERKQFLASHVERFTPKRRRTTSSVKPKMSRRYFLPNQKGQRFEVCQRFFLATCGYTTDSVVRQLFVTTPRDATNVAGDKRGKHAPANKLSTNAHDAIKDHINSYHPCISHYRRKHAPNRKYLPPDVTINAMHTDYKTNNSHASASYETYRRIVRGMNISFAKTGGEVCEQCDDFNQNHKLLHADFDDECSICQDQREHNKNAIEARAQYRHNATSPDPETTYLSADMQKVQLIPRMPHVKTSFFTSRLLVFHETFAPLGELQSELDHNKRVFACVWHEATTGRSAADVASAFHAAIDQHQSTPNLKIWLDNCTSQNKNWYLFTTLVRIMNTLTTYPDTVELLFLEKGHTFMSADSFHGHVEKYIMRKACTRPICDFDDFKSALECCGVAPKVHQLDAGNVRQWDSGVSKGKGVPKIPLSKVKVALFEKGNTLGMRVKLSHSQEEEYTDYPFLKKNTVEEVVNKVLPPVLQKDRGISNEKKRTSWTTLSGTCQRRDRNRSGEICLLMMLWMIFKSPMMETLCRYFIDVIL